MRQTYLLLRSLPLPMDGTCTRQKNSRFASVSNSDSLLCEPTEPLPSPDSLVLRSQWSALLDSPPALASTSYLEPWGKQNFSRISYIRWCTKPFMWKTTYKRWNRSHGGEGLLIQPRKCVHHMTYRLWTKEALSLILTINLRLCKISRCSTMINTWQLVSDIYYSKETLDTQMACNTQHTVPEYQQG